MAATATVKRPRVIAIVILSLIGGVLGLIGALSLMPVISAAQANGLAVPGWLPLLNYLNIILSILAIVSAVLIFRYKRLGLILGAVVYGISILLTIVLVVTGQSAITGVIISVVIDLVVLYYIYLYLTREPDKSFFS
jgi:hypothetical protein